jgi:hypothetical protein
MAPRHAPARFDRDGDESFLRDIFAQTQAARRAVGDRTDQRLIPLDDLPKRVAVTSQAPLD